MTTTSTTRVYMHEWQRPREQALLHLGRLQEAMDGALCECDEIGDGKPQWGKEEWAEWAREAQAALNACSGFMDEHFQWEAELGKEAAERLYAPDNRSYQDDV
jgi:hypothetical protein